MKTLIKIILTSVILITVISFTVIAQTNVSGGIYSNTTWTFTGSPYIVTDTVVVFPGVTLTIEPGVEVRFADTKYLELRQATLIALGTATDSIMFTSNSTSPTTGSWGTVWVNGGIANSEFNYCNFKYADYGLQGADTIRNSNFIFNNNGLLGGVFIDSCNFTYNGVGLSASMAHIYNCNFLHNQFGIGGNTTLKCWIKDCVIDSNQTGLVCNRTLIENCIINHNQIGIQGQFGGSFNNIYRNCIIDSNSLHGVIPYPNDSLVDCEIKSNGIGVNVTTFGAIITRNVIESNSVGIMLGTASTNIYCNRICNNTTYNLQYTFVSGNGTVANNYWCTADSASTEVGIYDGYDNIMYGLVNFMPIDTLQCYLTTGILTSEIQLTSFSIFPNPAADYISIELPATISNKEIKIFNMCGELTYLSTTTRQNTTIDISTLVRGVYIIQIATRDKIGRQKLIKQ